MGQRNKFEHVRYFAELMGRYPKTTMAAGIAAVSIFFGSLGKAIDDSNLTELVSIGQEPYCTFMQETDAVPGPTVADGTYRMVTLPTGETGYQARLDLGFDSEPSYSTTVGVPVNAEQESNPCLLENVVNSYNPKY